MKCKVGDRVRFLNDVGGGKVTRIEKNTIYVLGDDGFEVPMLPSNIIVIDKATESSIQNQLQKGEQSFEEEPLESTTNIKDSDEEVDVSEYESDLAVIDHANLDDEEDPDGDLVGLYMAFVPKNQENIIESDQELYIINDSPYRAFYAISQWDEDSVLPIRAGFLYADTKEIVKVYRRDALNADLTINVQVIFFKNRQFVPQQPEFYDLRINPTKFYRAGSFTENDFFDEKAMIFTIVDGKKEEILKTLTNKSLNKVIEQKESGSRIEKKPRTPEVEEIDLHIHELVDNPKDYTSGQIIEIQLARFKVALEGGVKSKVRKMVFIHGVGNGKLKHEIRKELEKNYPKLRYQDASFREYGYGATMVFIKS